ncbi:hypothetical protein P5V15_010159 [Pogonomyrmex californicus]
MSGYICAVKSCKNNTARNKGSFFKFPKDLKRAKLWLKFCNSSIDTHLEHLYKNYRICNEHFVEHAVNEFIQYVLINTDVTNYKCYSPFKLFVHNTKILLICNSLFYKINLYYYICVL